MYWLLLLGLLSTSSSLKDQSGSSLNRLAEQALRQRLGSVQSIRVDVAPRGSRAQGDFQHFNIALDGFSLDRLVALADRAEQQRSSGSAGDEAYLRRRQNLDLEDIFGGDFGDFGDFGGLGDILGGLFGKKEGRISKINLSAGNFTFQGARYDNLTAQLSELRF